MAKKKRNLRKLYGIVLQRDDGLINKIETSLYSSEDKAIKQCIKALLFMYNYLISQPGIEKPEIPLKDKGEMTDLEYMEYLQTELYDRPIYLIYEFVVEE